MSQHAEKLAVLFADVCGSTALYEKMGDDTARRLILHCLSLLAGRLPVHRGRLVKTIGDEILCTFPTAEAAFQAACAMQDALKKDRISGSSEMYVRIGFHYGDVICENGDVFGDTVNVAARVAAITRAGQIMTTGPAVGVLPQELQIRTRHIMRAEFKGKQEYSDIYVVIWEQEDTMSTRIGMPAFRKTPDNIDEMLLQYGKQTFRINKEHRRAMIGRGDICDIVVLGDLASRQHATIELRFGKFVMADQSTNGTYVRFADGHVVHVTREEAILQGRGEFSLGEPFGENPSNRVEFAVTAKSHH